MVTFVRTNFAESSDVDSAPKPQDTEAVLSQTKSTADDETSEIGDMSNISSLNQSSLSQKTESSQKSATSKIQGDEAPYRAYHIRKTTTIVNRCIKSGVKLEGHYVKMARTFLSTPDELSVNEIEVLNLKCQGALQSEHSSDSGSDTDEPGGVHAKSELILPPKPKRVKSCETSTSSKMQGEVAPSFHFGTWLPQPQQNLYYQPPPQLQNYGFSIGQAPAYAPIFRSYQYPPPTYSQTPQFRFGSQSYSYKRKPDSFQIPFHFPSTGFQQKTKKLPISTPTPAKTSTPKPSSSPTQTEVNLF